MQVLVSARDCAVPVNSAPGTWARSVSRSLARDHAVYLHSKMYFGAWKPFENNDRYSVIRFPRYPQRFRTRIWPSELKWLSRIIDPDFVFLRVPDNGLESAKYYGRIVSEIDATVFIRFTFAPTVWPSNLSTLIFESARIICETNTQADIVQEQFDVSSEKIQIIPNGVDVDMFSAGGNVSSDNQFIEGINKFTNRFSDVCAFAGAFDQYRCVTDIISGFIQYSSDEPDCCLVMIGDGPQFDECRRLVRDAGIEQRVQFTGKIDHDKIPYVLGKSDLAFALSHPDVIDFTTPIKLFEAFGAGVPVVASDGGDFPKYVDRSVGDLVEDHEPETVAAAINSVLDRSFDQTPFNSRAREYSWTAYCKKVTQLATG